MDEVELGGVFRHHLQQHGIGRIRVDTFLTQAQRLGPNGMKPAPRLRIAAREQRHVVPQFDQFIHQPSNYPLCATIKLWGYAFSERSELSDAHRTLVTRSKNGARNVQVPFSPSILRAWFHGNSSEGECFHFFSIQYSLLAEQFLELP